MLYLGWVWILILECLKNILTLLLSTFFEFGIIKGGWNPPHSHNFWFRRAMNLKLGRNVHYHNRNSWKKFQFCDVIIQAMTSSQSFRLPLTSEKVPFTKIVFKLEQSKIFQFCFDFLKAKRTIFNIISGF